MARPRKPRPPFPNGIQENDPVKVTSKDFKGIKLGLVMDWCKHNDGGIYVWLTGDSKPGFSVYACIQPERGDTIEGISVK